MQVVAFEEGHTEEGAAMFVVSLEALRVDVPAYEAFNPEAASFWPRHFTPVCASLMRVPEFGGAG